MKPLLLILALLLSLQLSPPTTAQEKPTFSARAELVVLHVTVEDRKGTYVSGLAQEAFTVLEDGRPQQVQFFSTADTPASIGLLVDNSTSMMNKREMVVGAAVGFTQVSNPEDEVFVLAFNENVAEIWKPRVIGASNMVSMRATLLGGIAAHGKTALYDAIARGLDGLNQGKHTRQVLVVISDGSDNASTMTLDDIPETLKHIARDIRSAYTIGFVPSSAAGDRALRKLRVDVRTQGRTLKARTRGGYVIKERS